MKRFITAVALCGGLLTAALFFFLPYTRAESNPIIALLTLPAPPPPNQFGKVSDSAVKYDETANRATEPPSDDAPIEQLLAYWTTQNSLYSDMDYSRVMSDRAAARVLAEADKKPEILNGLLNVLPETSAVVEKIKSYYDHSLTNPDVTPVEGDGEEYNPGDAAKAWLTNHSKYFTDDLYKGAAQVHDENEYLTNQDELLTLAHVDWERARPIVERLYGNSSQPVSQTLARWVYYKHAVENKDSGDADRYRDELKKTVENKSNGGGIRDLAMDALVKQGEWDGRDEWYYSLLEDETLYDLRVNGQTYTGLTTIIRNSKPGKYKDKMLELVGSGSPSVRGAAIRNLTQMIDADNKDVVKALLPWLENPQWGKDIDGSRRRLIDVLGSVEMPESVPGLLAVLNEKPVNNRSSAPSPDRIAANVADAPVREDNVVPGAVINALGKQKSPQAIAPIRQLLPQLQGYDRTIAVSALLACGGFSTAEQVDALEAIARRSPNEENNPESSGVAKSIGNAANAVSNAPIPTKNSRDDDDDNSNPANIQAAIETGQVELKRAYNDVDGIPQSDFDQPLTADGLKALLGQAVVSDLEPNEQLVGATVERISVLERKEPPVAENLRALMRNWHGAAVNAVMLRDLKNGKSDSESIVKLLSLRKTLRENQSNDVYDIRAGSPTALGISACLIENDGEYDALLNSGSAETKTAMFACARLIRAKLPVEKVAENLKSSDQLLAVAAEKYLESEDSPQARAFVLARHPNEAKILGATYYFADENPAESQFLAELFGSVAESDTTAANYFGYSSPEIYKIEKRLKKEVKADQNLIGIYAYDANYIRIYNDKAVYSREDGDSRYHERTLDVNEFENLKSYLTSQRVEELPPFLSACEDCAGKELLMLGRNGGRRVFVSSSETPDFFAGLDKIFEEMRQPPAPLHYKLEKDVAGLEIMFADENVKAQSVWKNGADLRVLVEDQARRTQIDKEIKIQERAEEQVENFDYEKAAPMRQKRREMRAFEEYSWQKIENHALAGAVAQPSGFDYIKKYDGQIPGAFDQWKRRTTNFEIRGSEEGIFKIIRGRAVKIQDGYYSQTVATPDGRWLVGSKYGENGEVLSRINLLTNKETVIKTPAQSAAFTPVVYVPSLGKMLVFNGYYGGEVTEEPSADISDRTGGFFLLDVETGVLAPAKGEFRPLAQQTFRPLQPTANADEFWTAIPDTAKNFTVVGTYNAKTLTFKPLLKIPKINFNSMNMWTDETEKKIYFVFDGHLLSLPLAGKDEG